jgi:hypothetical protein
MPLQKARNLGGQKGLLQDLSFLREQLDAVHIRKYPLLPSLDIGPRFWSDASYSVDAHGTPHMRVCCIIATTSASQGVVYDTDQQFFGKLCKRSSYIGIGELMGVLVRPAII